MTGVWTRIRLAFATFFTILFAGRLPAELQTPRPVETPLPPVADDTSDRAVQILALLQREGRFVDFVLEDVGDVFRRTDWRRRARRARRLPSEPRAPRDARSDPARP